MTANDPELEALLGAYALDAVDDEERTRVEEYIAQNPAAQAEVDELRETAAALALTPTAGTDMNAPPELWDRISQRIAEEPRDELAVRRARRSRRSVWAAALTAVAAAIVVVLGIQVVSLNNRLDQSRTTDAAFSRAVNAKNAKQAAMTVNGTDVARVVLLPDGSGYLKSDSLPKLSADQTYQLWALSGDPSNPTKISAGVLGPDPQTVGFHTNGPVDGLALTVEQSGGVVQSQHAPYAVASIT